MIRAALPSFECDGLEGWEWGARRVYLSAVDLRAVDGVRLWGLALIATQLHFADVDIVVGSGYEGLENERFGVSRLKLAITIDANLALTGFGASGGRVEEMLRVGN